MDADSLFVAMHAVDRYRARFGAPTDHDAIAAIRDIVRNGVELDEFQRSIIWMSAPASPRKPPKNSRYFYKDHQVVVVEGTAVKTIYEAKYLEPYMNS